jgi:hypothetical protein
MNEVIGCAGLIVTPAAGRLIDRGNRERDVEGVVAVSP